LEVQGAMKGTFYSSYLLPLLFSGV